MTLDDGKTPFEPLRKSVTVVLKQADAFDMFTARIGSWWPFATHSVSRDRTTSVALETHVGGRIFEVRDDAKTFEWGRVLVWEAPDRFVLTWHPGREPESAQEVEVRFVPVEGGTRVELEHRRWASLGKEAREARRRYDRGWEGVLGEHFLRACEAAKGARSDDRLR